MIKIATWNVNSLKIRLEQVLFWFEANLIDVLALQETKVTDENFPKQSLEDLGYHFAYCGQKSYNGMAFISRLPLQEVALFLPDLQDSQRRLIAATVGGIRIINVYVPNGASLDSEKYHYKLQWLASLKKYLKQQLEQFSKVLVLGDFNIAPEDNDVYDPKVWQDCTIVSPRERQAFFEMLDLGLIDGFRHFNKQQAFSWWDYRLAAFRRNLGIRIDHILISKPLLAYCKTVQIDKEPRKHLRPSDHAPVWLEIDK